MSICSKHDFDHRMRGQGAVQVIQLLTAGGGDVERHAQVVAAFAGAQLDGGGVKARVELQGHLAHGFGKAVDHGTHDLDGKDRGVLDQAVFAGVGARGWGDGGAHGGLFLLDCKLNWPSER